MSTTLIAVAVVIPMHYPNTYANQINTTQAEPNSSLGGNVAPKSPTLKGPNQAMHDQNSVNWSGLQGAVAISVTRKKHPLGAKPNLIKSGTASFLSSAVMISPTVGLTAAHGMDDIIDAVVYNAATIDDSTPEIRVKNKKIHPDYKGNNFAGIDLAIFELDKPLQIPIYFIPTALNKQLLQNAVLQRIGFGERDTGDGEQNRRTWVLENYNRRITGDNYLTAEDKYGYAGDSGGPVFRSITSPSTQPTLELVGIHVGRMLDRSGNPINESNTLILNSDIVEWIKKTAASFAVVTPTTPASPATNH